VAWYTTSKATKELNANHLLVGKRKKPRAPQQHVRSVKRRANGELPDFVRPPVWPARLRLANQTFDLTFCPANQSLRAYCQGKKSVNSPFDFAEKGRP